MSETTNIGWTDHTGGPWLGCTEVSPGCVYCYARELAFSRLERIFRTAYQKAGFDDWETRPVWGDKATRVMTKGFWKDVLRLNAQAGKDGVRRKWFPSLIDILDSMPGGVIDQDGNRLEPVAVRAQFLNVVRTCTNLDFLMLTKRAELWRTSMNDVAFTVAADNEGEFFESDDDSDLVEWLDNWMGGSAPENVWFGTTVEDQPRTSRIDALRKIPAKVHFLSVEPQLERIKLPTLDGIDWLICGGESGPGARPFHVEWARDLRDQCKAAGVAFYLKQMGANVHEFAEYAFYKGEDGWRRPRWSDAPGDCMVRLHLKHPKGADPSEWPEDLRVQEWPEGRAA